MGCAFWAVASLLLASSERDARALTITWSDAHNLAGSLPEIREEVESTFRDAGIGVRFAEEPEPDPRSPGVTVVVTPSDPAGAGWRLAPTAMGVHLVAQRSSSVFVFYRRVVRALGGSDGAVGLRQPGERRELSRAIARVAVHEIVHRFAPDLPHADSGLMQPELDRAMLTRDRVALDPLSRAAMRSALDEARPLVADRGNE
jgi:hypothetical protein